MSSSAARARLLAAALIALAAACRASNVDLGSDLHPRVTPRAGDAGIDAGRTAPAAAGTSGATDGSGGATPDGPKPSDDAGPVAQRDADVEIDQDAGNNPDDAGACGAHLADCDDDKANGCETNLDTDIDHCGTCDRACPPFGFMSFGSTCAAGRCVLTCESPHEDCDGNPDNGCEADLLFGNSADDNCGACGVICDCDDGVCR